MAGSCFDERFRGQLVDLFRKRRDVRHFRSDPIPTALMSGLLEAASYAPSVGLSQPWRFVTVNDAQRRARVRAIFQAANADALTCQPEDRAHLYARLKLAGLDQAPWHLAVFVEPDPDQGHGLGRKTMPETVTYSAIIAIHTIWLAARAAGLGMGWVSILDPGAVVEALDLPPHWKLVGYLCLGYPASCQDTPELELMGWEKRRPIEHVQR